MKHDVLNYQTPLIRVMIVELETGIAASPEIPTPGDGGELDLD